MHVAVLGAGYAGLALTRQLEDDLPAEVNLTIVDERETHLVQHLLHRIVREPGLAEDLRIPIAEVLDRAEHRQGHVEDVDADAGHVTLADGDLSYDIGAVSLGARTAFHGLPGVAEFATPLKRIGHARTIREDVLDLADSGSGRVIVGGAGLSGVQVAGELAALADDEGVAADVEVRLVEQAGTVAPTFPADFQAAVREELDEQGVIVETNSPVERAEADVLALGDGSERPYDQLVWTGGIEGRGPLNGRRPTVRARLRLGDRTLGLGDAVRVIDAEGTPVPASAQTALGMADVASTNLARLVEHQRDGATGFYPRLDTYRYDGGGWVVTVGDGAVAKLGPQLFRGRAARAVKTSVGTWYLQKLRPDVGRIERLRATLGMYH